ncbi:hypothetical protein R3P38DRAFT_2878626 [Favolaschia claudopus]|uniref:Transmembrane protein n=1 Tax=Favolaschia claudopus TaxID=2862362 RepID=A0AAW0CYE9_9AGAR
MRLFFFFPFMSLVALLSCFIHSTAAVPAVLPHVRMAPSMPPAFADSAIPDNSSPPSIISLAESSVIEARTAGNSRLLARKTHFFPNHSSSIPTFRLSPLVVSGSAVLVGLLFVDSGIF